MKIPLVYIGLPIEWIEQMDRATLVSEYTVSKRTLRKMSDGLLAVYRAELGRLKEIATEMERLGRNRTEIISRRKAQIPA